MISELGCDQVNYKFYMPQIIKLCESTFPGLKYEALEIIKEIYKWIRDEVLPFIEKLKQNQIVIII